MTQKRPPSEIILAYKVVGSGTHVFTAEGFKGFHIGCASQKEAFEIAPEALSKHVSLLYGCDARYEFPISYTQFVGHLSHKEPVTAHVTAKMAHAMADGAAQTH